MKYYILCPVRNITPEVKVGIDKYVEDTEKLGIKCHYPPRDVKQDDVSGGYTICATHRRAMEKCDAVVVFWDPASSGSHFDLGMAFALHKRIIVGKILTHTESEKSFEKVIETITKIQEGVPAIPLDTDYSKKIDYSPYLMRRLHYTSVIASCTFCHHINEELTGLAGHCSRSDRHVTDITAPIPDWCTLGKVNESYFWVMEQILKECTQRYPDLDWQLRPTPDENDIFFEIYHTHHDFELESNPLLKEYNEFVGELMTRLHQMNFYDFFIGYLYEPNNLNLQEESDE